MTVVAGTGLVLPAASGSVEAALQRSFTIRYQNDTNGAIDIFGNTLLTCPGNCASAQDPTGTNDRYNNQYNAVYIDADADGSTFNSSAATVAYPAGSNVLFAGLYWGAQSSSSRRDEMLLRAPGGAYSTISATTLDTRNQDYQAFADVTAVVSAAGTGEYWGANVRAASSFNDYAGWALVVVYENPALPVRNLTVFDGYGVVRNTTADRVVDVPISGFLTPPFGSVNAEVGVIAYEGDGGLRGDQFLLDGVALSNAQNSSTDFFNSTISTAGVNDGGRNPGYQNTFGFDADEVDASGILANASTSATVRLTTSGDAYYPGVLTTQIDLYAPRFPEITKTVVDVNGGTAQVGDVLHYSIDMTNVGLDPAIQSVIVDPVPDDTTFVPGSILVDGVPMSDLVGDDLAVFDGSAVRANVGVGATSLSGGVIGPNGSARVEFDVVIDPTAAGLDVANQAQFQYVAQTLAEPFTFRTNTVVNPVDPMADLSIVKTASPSPFVAGAPATYTLVVSNAGPSPAPNVTVADVLPPAFAGATVSTTAGSCDNTAGTIDCDLGTVASGATVTIEVTATLSSTLDPAVVFNNTATVTGDVTDPDPDDNVSTISTGLDAAADLVISKTATPATAVAGSPITYTIDVVNDGPSDAVGVSVSEALPATLLGATLTPSAGGSCTGSTCTFPRLASGATATVTVAGTVDPSATGSITNSATASSRTPDPVPADNTVELVTPIVESADLVVAKSASPSPAVPGAAIEYTITVGNAGPSTARSVTLSDPLPGLTDVAVASSSGTCTVGATVECAIGTVPPGATVTVTIDGNVPADRTTPLSNTATASSSTPDPNGANDADTIVTPVAPSADLAITKTANPNPLVAGAPVTYTVTVVNNGPSDAAAVAVLDTVPADLTGVTASSSVGSCTGTSCDLGTLAVGGSATITVTGDVPGTADPLTVADNTATVSSDTDDPDISNNEAVISTGVAAVADLRITKSVSPTSVIAGTSATWTVEVTNDGPSAAGPFEVVDLLPATLTPTAATIGGNPCAVVGQQVTCDSLGLLPGASAVVTITSDVASTAPAGSIGNTATIANATTPDPTASNNSASATVAVTRAADLSIEKTAVTDPVTPGLPATFTLELNNAGPSSAAAVLASDALPVGWSLDPSSDPRCAIVSGQVQCDAGVLAPGATEFLTVVVVSPPNATTGPFTNTATVSSSTPDPNPTDNINSDGATLVAAADLSVTKTDVADPVIAGEPIGYTIEVANAGPSDASAVTLDDADLAALDDVALVPSQGTCSNLTYTCDFGVVPAGTTVSVAVSGTVPAVTSPGADVLSNTVTVTGPDDPDGSNNSATETTSVERSADLVIAKSVSPLSGVAGDPVTWTIATTNQGPSAADTVVIADSLPAGLVASTVEVTTDAGSCAVTATDVSCAVGTVVPGDTVTVTVTAQIDPGYVGATLVNTATATSPDPDENPADNEATVTVPVQSLADLTISKNPSNPTPVAGDPLDWVIQVVNDGPSTALDVDVSDVLPAAFTVDSVVSTPAGCTALPCDLGDLAVGALVTIVVSGDIDPSTLGPIENRATVTSATTDPNPVDDEAVAVADVGAVANLSIEKVGDLAEFVAGSTASWTITVDNTGPSDALDVVVTDVLPVAGYSGVTATPSQGSCPTAASCDLGTIVAGGSATIVVSGTVSPAYADADITNAASVATSTFDPDDTDDTTSATVPVVPVADVSIVKLATGAPFVPGAPIGWTLEITNNGPSAADAVTVDDTLPTGATITSAVPTAGSCTGVGTDTLACDLGTLAPGASVMIDLDADLDASIGPGTLGNTATVTSDTDDPDLTDNTSTAVADVAGSADLSVTKQFTSAVVAGNPISWTMTVDNAGPSDAADVTVTDVVPTGIALDPLPVGCTGTDTITCTASSLADGDSAVFVITGTLDPDARGTLANSATVASTTTDPDTTDNTSTVTAPIVVTSAVVLTKTAPSPAPVPGGAPGRWTITLTNNGPSTANGVVIDDPIVNAIDAVIGSAGTLGSCDTTVSCTIGDLPPGTTITVLVDVDYPSDTAEGPVTNTATVTADTPLTGTTTADDTVTLVASADLSITKTIIPDTVVTAGNNATYRITVSNSGPSDAAAVTVSDPLPPAATFPVLDPAVPGCAITGSDLDCSFATVAPGTTIVVDVDFVVSSGAAGALDNTVALGSTTADPDPSDNTATVTAGVATVADLVLTKNVVTAGPYVAGGPPIDYELTIENIGPSDAVDAVLADVLPDGLTFVSATGDLTCSAVGAAVTCDPVTIVAGNTATVTVTASIDADATAGPATNAAEVASLTTDPAPENNLADATVAVVRSTDVTFAKSADAADVTAGQTASWTLSGTVDGPSTAEASTVSDTVPIGFTPTAAVLTVNGGIVPAGCTISGRAISCPLGDLDPGDTFDVSLTASIDPALAAGTFANNANFSTITPGGSSTADADVVVGRASDVTVDKATIGTGPFVAGEPLDWTITVTNPGPSTSENVVVTELAPTGYTVTGLEPSQGTCALSCALGTLPVGASATVTVRGVVDPDAAAGTLTNSVSVDTDELATPSVADADATVEREAALRMTKTASPVVATAGEPLTWTITLSNDGPSTADVTVTDAVPIALVAPAVTPSTGSWSAPDWDVGVLAPGDTAVLTIAGTLASAYASPGITNAATLVSDTPNPGDTGASVVTPVIVEADLEVVKRTVTDPVVAGAPVVWEVDVTNIGSSDAAEVVLTDTLPFEVVPGSAVFTVDPAAAATCDDNAGTCDFGTIPAGTTTATVTVTATVAADTSAGVDLVNDVAVATATADADPDNDEASSTATVTAVADIDITKRAVTDPLVAGDEATWEIEVTNTGPSDAQDVVVTDTPPTSLTAAVAESTEADCVALVCTVPTLAAGSTVLVTVSGTLAADAADGSTVTNTATVTSPTDPDPDPITAEAVGTMTTSADLRVAKETITAPVAGESVVWLVTVTNDGPSDARDVVVTESVPAEVDDAVFDPSAGTCTTDGVCTIDPLAAGASATIEVTADVPADLPDGTTLTNDVAVASATADPDPLDDEASTGDDVSALADVGVELNAPATATPGSPATFTVDVTNDGPSVALDVVVTFPVPVGVSVAEAPDGCSLDAGVITCSIGTLAPGETVSFDIGGVVDAERTEPIASSVAVESGTADPDPTNDSDTAVTAVAPTADLSVVKTGPTTVVRGTAVSWQIVVANAGPSTAVDVVLSDQLPDGLRDVSVSDADLVCDLTDGDVTCTWAALATGESRTVTIDALVSSTYADSDLLNTAAVSSATYDPDESNDTSGVSSSTGAEYDLSVLKTVADDTVAYFAETTFTFVVANDGPSAAAGVVVTDVLPEALEVMRTPAGCAVSGRTITCDADELDAGDTATFDVVVRGQIPGPVENCATVAGTGPGVDPDATNDESCASLEVGDAAELVATKTTITSSAIVGSTIEWVVTLTNRGPSPARQVVLVERPATGLTLTTATPSIGQFDAASGRWTLDQLDVGASATLTVRTRVTAAGTLTNAVSASSPTADAAAARAGTPSRAIVAASTATVAATSGGTTPATGAESASIARAAWWILLGGVGLWAITRRRRLGTG